jgi:hypothetical protein
MSGIARDEWLAALKDAQPVLEDDPSVLSTRELAEIFGLGLGAAKHRVELLVKAGKAQITQKPYRQSDGRIRTIPAYRLLK